MVMHSLAVQGNVRRYLAADAPKMRMRMFTDLIGLAKGDVLDGQEGAELVDEVEVGGTGERGGAGQRDWSERRRSGLGAFRGRSAARQMQPQNQGFVGGGWST